MNGRYLLDTNAIINLLREEHLDFNLKDSAGVFFVSMITEIELLSFKDITVEEENAIKELLPATGIIGIDEEIKQETIELKRNHNIKLPDAVICATASCTNLTLVTDDKKLSNIPGITTIKLTDLINI